MDSSNGFDTAKGRLPLIPLSPLTQTSIEYAKALAQTTKSLSETTTEELTDINNNSAKTSNILSLLNKDFSKERERLDRLTKEIQNIQSQSLADLSNYDIAKEIAYINCSLFRLVVLDKNWLLNSDKQSNMVPLLDFHRYVSHSFCHQIIYSAMEDDGGSKKNRRKSLIRSSGNSNTIAQVIQIAYILLHIYRDFSGCTALLASLQMPEVQRLEKLWAQCPSKLMSVYKELVTMLSLCNNYEAYQHYLWLHTGQFLDATAPLLKSQMIAVPFMHAHLAIIRNLIKTHSVVAINSSEQFNNNIVLSDTGEKSFISFIRVLEFCQQHSKIDPADLEAVPSSTTSNRLSISSNRRNSSNSTSGIKLSISPCLELDRLHSSPSMYHWLVSRPYLTRSQLHQESLQVEPLAIGEIDLETEEEYDLYWDFFTHPTEISNVTTEHQKQKMPDLKLQQPEEENQQVEEQEQNIVDDLVIVTSHYRSMATKQQQKNGDELNLLDSSVDALISNIVSSPTLAAENNNTDVSKEKDTLEQKVNADDRHDTLRKVTGAEQEEGERHQQSSESANEDEDDQTDIIIVAEEEENNQLLGLSSDSGDVVESPKSIGIKKDYKTDDKIIEKEAKEALSATAQPILSPTVPEFISQQQPQLSDEEEIVILTESTTSSSCNNVIIFEEKEEEEEEEEWTGYPLENSVTGMDKTDGVGADEEEEEWTGYPITSPDEEGAAGNNEDEEEVWKGYPAPQQQNSIETLELPSPSTSQEDQHLQMQNGGAAYQPDTDEEEWRGYQKTYEEETNNAVNNRLPAVTMQAVVGKDYLTSWDNGDKRQLHAIGKAAARRMQYSISNTDNRKRLPSSFTPSSAST